MRDVYRNARLASTVSRRASTTYSPYSPFFLNILQEGQSGLRENTVLLRFMVLLLDNFLQNVERA